jgi:hypothetical protein
MATVHIMTPGSASVADIASPEPISLVLVCAWCGQPIGRAVTSRRRIISHGMCRPCLEELLAVEGRAIAATGR